MSNFNTAHGALVSRSLPAIAKIIASKLGVKVFFDAGSVPYADSQGIHLPKSMSACGSEEQVILLNGFLDHEAAHIRYSDFIAIRRCRTPFEKTVLNIIEDIRIEDAIGKVFPGCKKNLAKTAKILDGNAKPRKGDDASNLICGFLSTNLRLNVLGHEINFAGEFRKAVLPIFGTKLLGQVEKLALAGSKAKDTDECYDHVKQIVDLLQQKSEEDKSESQDSSNSEEKSDEQDESSNGSQNSDEKSDDNQENDSESKSQDQGENSENSDESGQGQAKADDQGESSDESGQPQSGNADSNSDESAENESTAKSNSNSNGSTPGQPGSGEVDANPSKPGSGAGKGKVTEDADDQIDQEALKEALNGTGKDAFAEALAEAMKSLCSTNPRKTIEEEVIVNLKNRGDGKFQTKETDSGVRKVAGKFDLLLWSKTDNQPYAASSGKLIAGRLASVVTQRNIKICDRVDEADGLNTAIQVMFDVSGSMDGFYEGTDRYSATQTAAIIAGVCERYDGIKCGVAGFDDAIFPIKDFDEKWPRVGNRINKMAGGNGTAMGAAHTYAIGEMLKCDENRKVILIATDGEPNSFEGLSASVSEAQRHGLETRFVLIGSDANVDSFKAQVPGASCVTKASNADEIPNAILASLTGGLGLS
jgi:cobaltochelatase CobT